MSLTKLFKNTPQFIIIEAISSAKEDALKRRLESGYIRHIKEKQEKFYDYINMKSKEYNISMYDAVNRYFTSNFKDLFNVIMDIDPTENKKYANWLVDIAIGMFDVMRGNSSFSIAPVYKKLEEDKSKIKRNLKIFTLLKDRNKLSGNEADINQYDLNSLFDKVKPYLDDPDFLGTNKEVIMNESEIIYDDNGWKIVKPETHRASCFWGSATNWCTAVDDDDTTTFDEYKEDGDLYILIREKGSEKRKFQFHWGVNDRVSVGLQFMNEEDVESFDEMWGLVSKDLFNDLFGLIIFDSEGELDVIEFLYSLDSFCDHVNNHISPPLIWSDFLPQSSHEIIIKILREYINSRVDFKNSSTREKNNDETFNNSEKILLQFFKDGEDKDKENFLEFLTSDVGGSKIVFFLEQSKNEKLLKDLENNIIKYYNNLMK